MPDQPNYESGIRHLFDGLKAYFEDQEYSAAVHYGIRAYFEQWNQGPGGADRVVVIAGEFHGAPAYQNRPYGRLGPKLQHAQLNPAEVAQWTRPVTLSVWAAPTENAPHDELSQNQRTEALLESVRVGLQVSEMADLKWGTLERVSPPQERGFGEAILVHLEQRGPLFFPQLETVVPVPAVGRASLT